MIKRLFKCIVIGFLLCACMVALAQSANSETVVFKIVDANNSPIKNAVVAIKSKLDNKIKAKPVIMDQVNLLFVPRVLVVQQHQQVLFPNSDDVRHHVYSFSHPNSFEIKLFKGSEKQSTQFSHGGIAILGCNIHDGMVGFIYVVENEIAAVTNDDGEVTLDISHALNNEVQVWHEHLSMGQQERQTMSFDTSKAHQQLTVTLIQAVTNEPDTDSFSFKKRF